MKDELTKVKSKELLQHHECWNWRNILSKLWNIFNRDQRSIAVQGITQVQHFGQFVKLFENFPIENIFLEPLHYGPSPGEIIFKILRLLHLWIGNFLKLTMVVVKCLNNDSKIGRNEILWLEVGDSFFNLV